jgi:hypothetical protein
MGLMFEEQPRKLKCDGCGKHFQCYANSYKPCWCMEVENISIDESISDCLCLACLEKK